MNKAKLLFVILIFISLIGCSPAVLIHSNIVESEISIDGNPDDWNGKLKYFEDEKIAVGFQNDEDNLYFCLVTSNKSHIMKIMSVGLTTWFEPVSDEQVLGLQYPKRMDKVAPQSLMGKNKNQNGSSDIEMTINAMMQNQGEFAIVDDDGENIYASPIGSNDGYEMKVDAVNRQFVYEAKIPIGNNNQAHLPINIFPDEKFTIEFETGEIDMAELKNNDRMQGGEQGMRGNMQSSGRGGISRMGMERFKLSVEVKLAK